MRKTTLTQSGAPGRVIGWPISHTDTQYMDLSKFSTFHWICLLFIVLTLVGVELPLCIVVTLSNLFSGAQQNERDDNIPNVK